MSPQTGTQGFRVSGDTMGARLRAARDRMGLSLAEVEAELKQLPEAERPDEVSSSVIGRWERDQRSAPADYLLFLVRRSGADPAWLLAGGEPSAAELALDAIRLIVGPGGPAVGARVLADWMNATGMPPLPPTGATGEGGQ